jgi:hypothetical protein
MGLKNLQLDKKMEKKNGSSLFTWTKHSQAKIKQYMLSESRVKRVIRNPLRVEKGIAPKTLASMQKAGSKKHPYEIWTMYQLTKGQERNQIKVISAWKYPGVTQPGDPIPIPPDIFEEIIKSMKNN